MFKSLLFVAVANSNAELKTRETCKGETLPGKIYEFSLSKNKTLYFLDANLKKNFGETRIFCETSILTGGNLWCPSSQKEYNTIAKDVLKADFAYLGIQRVFDQTNPLAEREVTDSWECVHNKEIAEFTFWDQWYADEQQPSTNENDDVVFALGYETDFRGAWHSGDPSRPMSVFCQIYCDEEEKEQDDDAETEKEETVEEKEETVEEKNVEETGQEEEQTLEEAKGEEEKEKQEKEDEGTDNSSETDKIIAIKAALAGIDVEALDDNLAKLIGQIKKKVNDAFIANDMKNSVFSDENLLKIQTIIEHLELKEPKLDESQPETSESIESDTGSDENKTEQIDEPKTDLSLSQGVSENEESPLLSIENNEGILSGKSDTSNESEIKIAKEFKPSGPTNIQTSCDVNSLVNLEFDFLGSKTAIDPMSIKAGSCSLRTPHAFSIATHEHDGYNHWTIRFNANLCGGIFQDNHDNFVQDSTTDVTFENVVFEDADGGKLDAPLVITDHVIKTRCRYKNQHTVKLSFGETEKPHEEISENTGGLSFSFSAFNNPAYEKSLEEVKTGEMVFVKLEPKNSYDAVGVEYAFSKCGFEEQNTGKIVTLFDAETGDGCHNELIPGLDFNGFHQLDNGIHVLSKRFWDFFVISA